ncbi:hypothetical protein KKE92_03650 [Candidatus Micrarchaeota archaeon]|nr:hypothetical protein [Candidatus Micrarchaeota archaeon]MBU1681314.1 hypothetical protein [Candidatus Micrarchaeota archaeon]
MKESEVKLNDEGFEEIQVDKGSSSSGTSNSDTSSNRPDMRVVQADRDKDGNVVYSNVGGMWKNVSKNGNIFYTLKIGQLKLLVFPNNK